MDKMIREAVVLLSCGLLITGCTTLHTAASKGNVKAIERLVNEEANIDETDDAGKTPLMYAVMLNQHDSAVALLKAGADVNTQSDTGNTALHEAVIQGNLKFCTLLLEKGADVSIRNKQGKTPLDIAKAKENKSFIGILVTEQESSDKADHKVIQKEISNPPLPCPVVDTIEPIPVVTVQPSPVIDEQPVKVVDNKSVQSVETKLVSKPSMSKEEASMRLKKMIAGRETLGIRNFLNDNPNTIDLIDDPMQRIRYVGPSGFRIIDIIENMSRGKMKESDVISQISTSNLPYKNYTDEEVKMLSRYGISNSIIDAMVKVSK